ncbi:glycoside hydrolase family 2 protein [Exserohilum turcica Et28A]|uniref:Glycoside hydrolase family 2 protein n=1 Tax=Exserohilum turcicum (strain 28A) TaxID=671987 RepID=R0K3L7_EXST2|nr:glycoside hydrolase family 2 protein [Exserohilum turcica Et28A]EOA84149.1 glycoside hydrolase family 2 protein [Exserohilum turcica Et28A]
MDMLVSNGVYNKSDLFYSNNLQNVDTAQFRVPWYYRAENRVGDIPSDGYYTLKTNGITSKAEIWLNGKLVADKDTQAGAYGGQEYDITDKLIPNEKNVLLVKTYPTDYNRDLAISFLDWNPSPPDNGTGIWREIRYRRTGQVKLSTPRVVTHPTLDTITVFVDLTNLSPNTSASGPINCKVFNSTNFKLASKGSTYTLDPREKKSQSFTMELPNGKLWWPNGWGDQYLHKVHCYVATSTWSSWYPSDNTGSSFGLRTVESVLNRQFNDITFFINDHPFQVLGAAFNPDLFLGSSRKNLEQQFRLIKDMGLNTIRLEGKQGHPMLYEVADKEGIMILAGWECCDKWEAWTYNDNNNAERWSDHDYEIAASSMKHEAEMMVNHPSMLAFSIGSDSSPDGKATKIYVDALNAAQWPNPMLPSANHRTGSDKLCNGGMKMEGPYEWVPPNYWYDPENRWGSAAGFGSEEGAGVGTPELGSLKQFLSPSELEDLWKAPNKTLYHMGAENSFFRTREIYNKALWARYGAPTSLSDYLMKAQMMDYEATRAQFEAWISRWGDEIERPATGVIYWLLNSAWPTLHWSLYDYYMHPAGAYYGTKDAINNTRMLTFNYEDRSVYLIDRRPKFITETWPTYNHSIDIEMLFLNGTSLPTRTLRAATKPNAAYKVATVFTDKTPAINEPVLLRLRLRNGEWDILQKTYWVPPTRDVLDWHNSNWFVTPVSQYADLTALQHMEKADVTIHVGWAGLRSYGNKVVLMLVNNSKVPAVFLRLNLVDANGNDVAPVVWNENYVTLWPGENRMFEVELLGEIPQSSGVYIVLDGRNVDTQKVAA